MKSHRQVQPAKSPLRIPPVGAWATDHLSALAAFEQWQRESTRAGTFVPGGDSSTKPAA
jgi:hypothetical protein